MRFLILYEDHLADGPAHRLGDGGAFERLDLALLDLELGLDLEQDWIKLAHHQRLSLLPLLRLLVLLGDQTDKDCCFIKG